MFCKIKKLHVKNNFILTLHFLLISFIFTQAQAQVNLKTKSDARQPRSDVKYRQSGVPVFDLIRKSGNQVYKVKEIPRLDIGEEKQIEATDLELTLPPARALVLKQIHKPISPPILAHPTLLPIPVRDAQKIVNTETITNIPIVPALELVADPVVVTPEVQTQNLVQISADEYKMLQALVFLEYQKKYDLAMSLFVELMDVPQFRDEALFHYAETAFGLGLYSEFRHKMIQVTKQTKDLTLKKKATESLVKNVSSLETSDIEAIDPLVENFDIDITNNDAYLLKKAKFYSQKDNLGQLENALAFITSTSPLYPEALLLKAIFNYRQGQIDAAIADLETSWPLIQDNKKNQIRNLTALTLARLYFQKSDYKTAYQTYLKIDKSSPSWLQAMVEQAWTQILAGDHEGAAGNMFSLHTDYFRKAYAPDTYIVRTVGYLNLCQFGDGVGVLTDLKKRYSPIHQKLSQFEKNNKESDKYYDLVKTWLKNVDQADVDGLPRSFIVELARHPTFTAPQKQINNYEDENSRFNKITIDLIRKEKEARLKMLQAKNELSVLKREKVFGDKLKKAEQSFLARGVEHIIVSRAREGIKKMRTLAITRLDQEKLQLRTLISKNLQNRFHEYVAALNHLIDQNEVLSYEIYSGAGEHIRYQMAGGEAQERDPATTLAPDEQQSYKWKFKGEVWEDEIGHYRSSLKNVCPADDKQSM